MQWTRIHAGVVTLYFLDTAAEIEVLLKLTQKSEWHYIRDCMSLPYTVLFPAISILPLLPFHPPRSHFSCLKRAFIWAMLGCMEGWSTCHTPGITATVRYACVDYHHLCVMCLCVCMCVCVCAHVTDGLTHFVIPCFWVCHCACNVGTTTS